MIRPFYRCLLYKSYKCLFVVDCTQLCNGINFSQLFPKKLIIIYSSQGILL